LLSLITPAARIAWRRVGQGAAVWMVLSAATAAAEQLLYPGRYYLSFDPLRFVQFAALVFLLTPLQGATEELIFRGYFVQGLGLVMRRPLAIAVASSALFALPHLWNPEVQQHGMLLMAANYFAIGMVFATVALRDGRLELAIGMHAVNNVFLALVANYEGSVLASEAIFTARDLDPWYSLVTLVLASLAFYWWFFGRANPPP
jgi:membrane protease YdiL (CAAX protease family)